MSQDFSDKPLLSPEDRSRYLKEFLSSIRTRNDSLSQRMAEKWVEERLLTSSQAGMKIKNPRGLKAQVEKEMYLAGLDLLAQASKSI